MCIRDSCSFGGTLWGRHISRNRTGGSMRNFSRYETRGRGMVSSNNWTPLTILLRKHLRLLAVLPVLLWSCHADDPTAQSGVTEPGAVSYTHLTLPTSDLV